MADTQSMSRAQIRKSLRTNLNPGWRFWLDRVKLRLEQAAHLPALLAGGELDRPVFIVGAPRSGTHMLFVILRSSRRLAHWRPSEAHEVWELDHHPARRGWDSNLLDASDLTPDVAARIRRSFFLVAGSRRRLIDKTPRNSLRIGFVDAVFPDARYIYLKRDGRDNVNSLINAWRSQRYRTYLLPQSHSIPGTDPRWWKFVLYPGWRADLSGPLETICAKQWSICNEHLLDAAERIGGDRWTEVRYEDLVDDPVEEVGRLMKFIELPYDDEVRRRAEESGSRPVNIVTPPERGKWRRENPRQVAAVMPVIEPVMLRMGYRADD